MNKRQTRIFAIACTGLASVAFIGMTIDTHARVGELTNAENITPAVKAGSDVWHENNCINCHTLFGEGAYYAPDLTKITQLRGEPYLKAYMRDPSKFYDEQKHRRLMPKQDLSATEIDDLIAFLDWVSKVDNQGWPPRPILVAGSTLPGSALTAEQQTKQEKAAAEGSLASLPPGARPTTKDDDPIARGESLFRVVAPACVACHSISVGVNLAGPSLAGLRARAAETAEHVNTEIGPPLYARTIEDGSYATSDDSFVPWVTAARLASTIPNVW